MNIFREIIIILNQLRYKERKIFEDDKKNKNIKLLILN